jgi:hypothetical protein
MLPLVLATLMSAVATGAEQPPCDLVAEQDLPNCNFTVRSNYALHGLVRTVRVTTRRLAPDPRTRSLKAQEPPKLFIQEPGVWLVFSPDGDMIENSGSLNKDGSPATPNLERQIVDGLKTIIFSGTGDDPQAFRREETFAPDGALIEESAYQHDQLISRHVQIHDSSTGSIEDTTYDAGDNVTSYSSERHDKCGRAVEWILFSGGRMALHQRDSYSETCGVNDDSLLISRAWFDEAGLPFREIALHEGEATSWWQGSNCGELCKQQTDGVGLNFPFDHSVFYEFQPDGSLLRTIQHHKGRFGNIDNDDEELLNEDGKVLEKIAYSYVRDSLGNWTERTVSILDPATGQMLDVRLDRRDLTYY